MDKENMKKIIIKNNKGLEVILLPLAASIYSISLDGEILTLTPSSLEDFAKTNLYYGKTVGPIPNRIKDGKVNIEGKTYQLEINEGKNTLHSGIKGICNQLFDYEVINKNEEIVVIFSYKKKDMFDGLPGNIVYQIKYILLMN